MAVVLEGIVGGFFGGGGIHNRGGVLPIEIKLTTPHRTSLIGGVRASNQVKCLKGPHKVMRLNTYLGLPKLKGSPKAESSLAVSTASH